ncbi:MAG TPA: glycosyltransferase [Candidatus Binatia bacterium]
MKISLFGSSLLSAYWNGAATYYRGMLSALFARGHQIVFYEPDAWDRQTHRDLTDTPYAQTVVYPVDRDSSVVEMVKKAARESDLLIKASGVGVFDALLEQAVIDLRRAGTMAAFWDVDAAATLERIGQDAADPFRALIPLYDLILTYGGGDAVVQSYRRLGAQRCFPIYNALDPSTHYPAPPDPNYDGALSFLGNRLPDRESRVSEFFFKAAQANPRMRFVLGGSGWEDTARAYPNVAYLGHVYTAAHNAFNSSPMAVLNVCRESMARCGYSPPTRLFEVAGAAGCLITDAWQGIENFLEPGRECLVASDGDEVGEHLRVLTQVQAKQIGQAALRRIVGEHTYAHRAAELESLLQDL